MSKLVIAAVTGTILALGAASVWVPIARWEKSAGSLPDKLTLHAAADADARGDAQAAARIRGEWTQTDPSWPPRFGLVWRRNFTTEEGLGWSTQTEERVRIPSMLMQQALVLLLGGGILTLLVRRERQRQAARQ